MKHETRALLRSSAVNIVTILGYVSTASTFLPVMAVVRPYLRPFGLALIIIGIFRGAQSVLKEKTNEFRDVVVAKDADIAALNEQIARLSARPYDEQRRTVAQQTLDGCSTRQRDLLRYLLLHGNPTGQNIHRASTMNDNDTVAIIQQFERCDLVRRDEDQLQGIVRFFVNPDWAEVYRDLLFPRDEPENPHFDGHP